MYNVSDAYITAASQQMRTDKIKVEMFYSNMTPHCTLSDDDIEMGTMTVSRQCVNNDYFEFGAAYASELQFQTRTHKIVLLHIVGHYVRVTYSLQLADGTFDDVPVGMFRITECEISKGLYKITAYDCLVTLDWENIQFSVTSSISPYEMLKFALSANESAYHLYGLPLITVTLGNTKEEIEAMPNGTVPMAISDDMQTAREILSSVAELLGCYIEADKAEANKIWLRRFRADPVRTITPSIRFSYEVNIDWDRPRDISTTISYRDDGSSKTPYTYLAEGDGTFLLTGSYRMILDNKILNIMGETLAKTVADNLAEELTRLNQREYLPISFSFFGDPSIDVGDMVECEYNGTHNPSLIGGYVWNYRNAESITAIGGNKATDVSRSPSGLKNEPSASGSGSGSGSSDSMHYYEYVNTDRIAIPDGAERDVIHICAVSYRATDVVFMAEIRLDVDTAELITEEAYTCTDGVISAAYYVGTVEIGTARPSWAVQDGVHTIHLIHHFSMAGYHTVDFRVRLFVDGCSVEIPAQCIHGFLEGTYLAGEEAWDGLIEAADTLRLLPLAESSPVMNAVQDTVSTAVHHPVQNDLTDSLTPLTVETSEITIV